MVLCNAMHNAFQCIERIALFGNQFVLCQTFLTFIIPHLSCVTFEALVKNFSDKLK